MMKFKVVLTEAFDCGGIVFNMTKSTRIVWITADSEAEAEKIAVKQNPGFEFSFIFTQAGGIRL